MFLEKIRFAEKKTKNSKGLDEECKRSSVNAQEWDGFFSRANITQKIQKTIDKKPPKKHHPAQAVILISCNLNKLFGRVLQFYAGLKKSARMLQVLGKVFRVIQKVVNPDQMFKGRLNFFSRINVLASFAVRGNK